MLPQDEFQESVLVNIAEIKLSQKFLILQYLLIPANILFIIIIINMYSLTN